MTSEPDSETLHRIAELRKELDYHSHRYYVLDDPVANDSDYDLLMRELRSLESDHPELVTPESPHPKGRRGPRLGFQPGPA